MRRIAPALAALLLAAAAAAAEPPAEGFLDPPRRSPFAPAGPLRVVGGVTPISAINANDANGLSPLESAFVTIRGVVQLPTGTVDPFDEASPQPWFYVHDGTGAVAVARRNVAAISVAAGDSVEVSTFVFTQRFAPLRGTRTLDLGFAFVGDVFVRASGRPVQPAQPLAAGDVAGQGALYEGLLVSVGGLTVVQPSEWPATGASGFVRATDGTDTLRIYVDEDTNLDGLSPPAGTFGVTGFVAQDDTNRPPGSGGPFLAGHFVYPRSATDLAQGDGSGTATVLPSTVVEGAAGVSLAFTITGQDAALETVQVEIPSTWTWTAPGTVTLSGAGFASASASSTPSGSGGWIVEITGAAVDSLEPGTATLGALTAPTSAGTSVFPVRTAAAGGTPAPILDPPAVAVVSSAAAGEVVINELYPRTLAAAQGVERSEFLELRNRTGRDFVIGGWTLADIGRTAACTLGPRWAFPAGAVIPANGFVVVCQTARDPAAGAGFLVDFPGVPAAVYEMFDPSSPANRPDDPGTPNMVLVDPSPGDDRIYLLGGPNTNAGQCESPAVPGLFLPFQELVVLRNSLGETIDVVEYREPGPCTADLCAAGDAGGTGANDAYPYGAPKVGHTLGRDAASSDTDDSSADLRPSSTPTPGAANVPVDSVPPVIGAEAGVAISATLVEVRFDEPVDDAGALDPARYAFVPPPGGTAPAIREVLRDPAEPLSHFFLVTDPMAAGAALVLSVSGITDIAFDGNAGNAVDTTVTVNVPSDALPICAVQETDEVGFSPLVGDTVLVAGYVTILPTSVDRFSIWVQEPGAEGCGVNVFSFDIPGELAVYGLDLNDLVVIHGRVTEFISASSGSGAVTELASFGNSDFFRFLVRGLAGPEPRVRTTGGANDESLEGTLVRTEGTVVNSNALAAWIDDGSGAVQVFQNFSALDLTRYTVGDRLDVTGVITQFDSTEPYFEGYELVPQNQESIVEVEGDFTDSPSIRVGKRVLVPELGERMDITVTTPRRHDVIVEIFDAVGRKVTTLRDGLGLGEMRFEWDGRGADGGVVPPGVYLCHVRATPLDGGSAVKHTAPIVVGLRLEGGEAAR